jgi:hypothetical protein
LNFCKLANPQEPPLIFDLNLGLDDSNFADYNFETPKEEFDNNTPDLGDALATVQEAFNNVVETEARYSVISCLAEKDFSLFTSSGSPSMVPPSVVEEIWKDIMSCLFL